MKKIAVFVLGLMIAMAMTACGNDAVSENKSMETGDNTTASATKPQSTATHTTKDLGLVFNATIDETVLVDESGVKITAKEISYTNYSVNLSLLIENNSDKDLSFMAGSMGYCVNSINGYMVSDGYLNENVAPGMSVTKDMSFSIQELTMYGITDIADITVGFSIQDSNYNEYLVTGPREVKTSIASDYDYSKDTFTPAIKNGLYAEVYGFTVDYSAADEIFNVGGIRAISEFVMTNKSGERIMLIEVINESGSDEVVSVSDVALNGINAYSGAWKNDTVCAGKKAVLALNMSNMIDSTFYEAMGIGELKQLSFDLIVKDMDYKNQAEAFVDIPFGGTVTVNELGEAVYDSNGIKLFSKGILPDSWNLSDDVHVLLMVKNESEQEVYISPDYGGTYVNKFKVDEITYGVTVKPGHYGIIDVKLMGSDLEENNIAIDDITEVSITFEIRDADYNEIGTPTVVITN